MEDVFDELMSRRGEDGSMVNVYIKATKGSFGEMFLSEVQQ